MNDTCKNISAQESQKQARKNANSLKDSGEPEWRNHSFTSMSILFGRSTPSSCFIKANLLAKKNCVDKAENKQYKTQHL